MGFKMHQRSRLSAIAADGFLLEQEASFDGGRSWFLASKRTYTRRGK